MLLHFQVQSLYKDSRIPGWTFSFYYQQQPYTGHYLPTGAIRWTSSPPPEEAHADLEKQIHDLMIYHVYDQER